MTQRGRRSRASLSVVPVTGDAHPPEPPEYISDAERLVWRQVCASMRPDWFRTAEVQLLLESYCFTAAQVAKIAKALRGCNASDLDRLEQLQRIHRSTTMLLLSLATKLRLTPQSTRSAGRTKHDPLFGLPKPWEL
jgi:phage terminase small subunit